MGNNRRGPIVPVGGHITESVTRGRCDTTQTRHFQWQNTSSHYRLTATHFQHRQVGGRVDLNGWLHTLGDQLSKGVANRSSPNVSKW